MQQNDIVNVIRLWLDKKKWHYKLTNSPMLFKMGVYLKCELEKVRVVVDVKEDFYLVYAILDIGCAKCFPEMAKFITMANYGLINGNFEVDVRDGEIRYKTYVNCRGMDRLSECVIEDSILCACRMVRKYASGIAKLCLCATGTNADIEIKKCEPRQGRTA